MQVHSELLRPLRRKLSVHKCLGEGPELRRVGRSSVETGSEEVSGKGDHESTSAAASRIKGGVTMVTNVPSTHISLSPTLSQRPGQGTSLSGIHC